MLRTLSVLFVSLAVFLPGAASAATFTQVHILHGKHAGEVELKSARLLRERILERSSVTVEVAPEGAAPAPGALTVLLGVPENHDLLRAWMHQERIQPLGPLAPGPEGFLLQGYVDRPGATLLAAAVDQRGVLYAVGELLRKTRFHAAHVELPEPLSVRTAPAYEVRGTQYGQSHIAKSLAGVRPWTEEETHRVILDYALAGANVFDVTRRGDYEFIKSWGLMTQGGFGANTGSGPPEWEAMESIGRTGYLCLSVPEAVAAQIERCEEQFKNHPPYDFIKFHGGDGGGCECDRCKPYGLTFIKVVEQMAERIHRHHPETRIYFTNQKFEDADDEAIFEYLREKPRDWLWAWGYGPGSDALSWQPGHRQTHRMDLFRYPGHGPFDRYNQYIIHQLPPRQTLIHYNEITHWRYSQHGYVQMYPRADRNGDLPPWWNHFIYERRPDQALTLVYDRLTFYAWPRFYHWLFGEVNRYGVGDITHSSGHHDHFNNWLWQRLLWAPQTPLDTIVDAYCRTWFGVEAAPLMAEALYLLEENLEEDRERSITQKPGIDRYYDLVRDAGQKMPAHWMRDNWLWREYMQKSALDLHTKLAVEEQEALQRRLETRAARALKRGDLDRAIAQMLPWFEGLHSMALQPYEDPAKAPRVGAADSSGARKMQALREEAGRLGDESDALFGVRSEGYFNLYHDFIGLGWYKRQLERAQAAEDDDEKRELLRMIAAYEDPGPGGFYDNLGTFNPAPNVVHGYPYDHGQPYVYGMLDEGNRPSQKAMHFTQDEAQGVTLHYRGLDPDAAYRIRLTLLRPWFQERYAMRMHQKRQTIYADEHVLAKELELPYKMSDFFTFDIPREATADGELIIRLEKGEGVATGDRVTVEQWRNSGGWGTLLSEAWLMVQE